MQMFSCAATISGHPAVVNQTLFGKIGEAMTQQNLFTKKTKVIVLAGVISWSFEATEDEVNIAKTRFERFGNSFQFKALKAFGISFDFTATPIDNKAQYFEIPDEVKVDGKTVQSTEGGSEVNEAGSKGGEAIRKGAEDKDAAEQDGSVGKEVEGEAGKKQDSATARA